MSAKSKAFENDLLKLIFQAASIPGIADNAASSPISHLYIALHTQDPGESGNQSTNEVAYTGYARVAVIRSNAGWTVTSNSVSPAAPIEFGEMTAGTPGSATHASIGTAATGSGTILYRGALTPTIPYSVGVMPRLRTTTAITEEKPACWEHRHWPQPPWQAHPLPQRSCMEPPPAA